MRLRRAANADPAGLCRAAVSAVCFACASEGGSVLPASHPHGDHTAAGLGIRHFGW